MFVFPVDCRGFFDYVHYCKTACLKTTRFFRGETCLRKFKLYTWLWCRRRVRYEMLYIDGFYHVFPCGVVFICALPVLGCCMLLSSWHWLATAACCCFCCSRGLLLILFVIVRCRLRSPGFATALEDDHQNVVVCGVQLSRQVR